MMTWQIIALVVLIPLALFYALRVFILIMLPLIGPAALSEILEEPPTIIEKVEPPKVIQKVGRVPPITRKMNYYKDFSHKRDYS